MVCLNNTLCPYYATCAGRCLQDSYSVCVNNRTICSGFYFWNNNNNNNRYMSLCGNQQTCYDNSINTCVNGTTVCPGINARLCGMICYDPDMQNCSNNVLNYIRTCNSTCYSSGQYCHNNTKVCSIGESICDVKSGWPDLPLFAEKFRFFNFFPHALRFSAFLRFFCFRFSKKTNFHEHVFQRKYPFVIMRSLLLKDQNQ